MSLILSKALLPVLILTSVCRGASFRVIEGRPEIKTAYGASFLSVENEKKTESHSVLWPRHPDAPKVTLDPDSTYKFTYAGKNGHEELIKIEKGKNTIYDASICEIHKKPMDIKKVPIVYGLVRENTFGMTSEEFRNTENTKFPHHREHTLGGCVVTRQSPKTTSLWVCSDCKKAYADWKQSKAD